MVTLSPIVSVVRFVQLLKTEEPYEPIVVQFIALKTTDVKPLQLAKALVPMDVTLLGMVMEVKPLQSAKALVPMDVTPLGILTDVRPMQPVKA